MGYLLKEALKTLCGVNQWSYAVFWKIGCQNPKLLIWEECYYGPASCSGLLGLSANRNPEITFQDSNSSFVSAENLNLGDKVHLLVNNMMMGNHVNILGEGLVGRVAFTGNYQWILSESFYREAHPPEVLKEVRQQFSAGMQTVAVIPVLPHGVVQFGSFFSIMEDMGFVNDVVSLVLQLACVPGILQSENYVVNMTNASPFITNCFNHVGSSAQTSAFDSQISYSLAGETQNDNQLSHDCHEQPNIAGLVKLNFSSSNEFMRVAKAEVIPANANLWTNQNVSLSSSSTLNHGSRRCSEQNNMFNNGSQGHTIPAGSLISSQRTNSGMISSFCEGSLLSVEANGQGQCEPSNITSKHPSSSTGLKRSNLSKMEASFPDSVGHLANNTLLASCYGTQHHQVNPCKVEIQQHIINAQDIHLTQHNEHCTNIAELDLSHPVNNTNYDDACTRTQSGEDLYDVLGADFKNELFSKCWNNRLSNESTTKTHNWEKNNFPSKKNLASSEIYSTSQENSGIFSSTGTDHLLDAVVSRVHPSNDPRFDDNVSCKTTLANISSSSASKASLPYGRFSVSDKSKAYSQGSSIYDSWSGKEQNVKQSNSVATEYSSKPHGMSKTNRKRLKPGENPRPRPKDRQMIQDRVKELREIVPNGAKCSIDALLERTIKHMLFLQSVTKHADKLKQTPGSKIISKEDGLVPKDNNRGGATWAYEVGSQSMVCPIIVEDLNQPNQMLVEMLCEERGLFLEIADVIRGLGLTILRGLMETQNDKIWARFTVEANRDVTRMDVFLSLVRLLEQNTKTQPNNTSNNNMMSTHADVYFAAATGFGERITSMV